MAAGAFSHHGHKLRPWVGVCSAALLLAALIGSRDALAPGNERGGVVVARVEIPIGSRLIPEYLEVVQYPRNVLPRGTFPRVDDKLVLADVGVEIFRIDFDDDACDRQLELFAERDGGSAVSCQ